MFLLCDGEKVFPVDLEKPAADTLALFRYWLRMQRAAYRARMRQATSPAGRPKAIPEALDYLYRASAYQARLAVEEAIHTVRSLPKRANLSQRLRVDLRERFARYLSNTPRGRAVAAAIDRGAESVAASLRGAVSRKGPRAIADEITAAAFGVSPRTIRALCSPKSRQKTTPKR